MFKRPADSEDYNDLSPTITYRHLLSHNHGVRDPFRTIALCDSDAFYAACEMNRLGTADKPLVVAQWDLLLAVNYPARKFGITRLENPLSAKKKCPELIVIHVPTYKEGGSEPGYWDDVDVRTHKTSLDIYRRESEKIVQLFKDFLVDCEVEKASIDEAFMDCTKAVKLAILERYPHLSQPPAEGLDTPLPPPPPPHWLGAGYVIPVSGTQPPPEEGQEEPLPDPEDTPSTWHDITLSIGAELVQAVRHEIKTKLGYTTSAGIARNKFLAKLAASCRKPYGQTVLRNTAIPNYLKPMAFQKIRNLGGKLGDEMSKEFKATTVEEMLLVPLEKLQHKFPDSALRVFQWLRHASHTSFCETELTRVGRGIDRSDVKEKPIVAKSMLAGKSLPDPVTNADDGSHWIRVLSTELCLRLHDAREIHPSLWPKTLSLHVRTGWDQSKSKQAPFPFTANITVETIAGAGNKLWSEIVSTLKQPYKVAGFYLSFHGVHVVESGQQEIKGFLRSSTSKRPREEEPADDVASSSGFFCERCTKRISFPEWVLEDEMEGLKMEHSDFHFAQDLAREGETVIRTGNESAASTMTTTEKRPVKRAKKTVEKGKGIEQFFMKKSL